MSLTQSRGMTDAGRWTAVATTLAEHLEAYKNAREHGEPLPSPPVGAIERARRFFLLVLNGIDFDHKKTQPGTPSSLTPGSRRPSQAMAAGISNLSIAVKVMRSTKVNASTDDLGEIERQIKSLLSTLERLEMSKEGVSVADCDSLANFVQELQRQGEIERDATVAAQERPRSYSTTLR